MRKRLSFTRLNYNRDAAIGEFVGRASWSRRPPRGRKINEKNRKRFVLNCVYISNQLTPLRRWARSKVSRERAHFYLLAIVVQIFPDRHKVNPSRLTLPAPQFPLSLSLRSAHAPFQRRSRGETRKFDRLGRGDRRTRRNLLVRVAAIAENIGGD